LTYTIRRSNAEDRDLLVSIWRSSVADTHSFVTRADLSAIDVEVQQFLPTTPAWLALDQTGRPIAFMVLTEGTLEALFVVGDQQGRGVGRALIEHAMRQSPTLATVVNEQNAGALGFYRHVGFKVVGRSATDEQGRPYPILHMEWKG
jgi:putative acetyltransferase